MFGSVTPGHFSPTILGAAFLPAAQWIAAAIVLPPSTGGLQPADCSRRIAAGGLQPR